MKVYINGKFYDSKDVNIKIHCSKQSELDAIGYAYLNTKKYQEECGALFLSDHTSNQWIQDGTLVLKDGEEEIPFKDIN